MTRAWGISAFSDAGMPRFFVSAIFQFGKLKLINKYENQTAACRLGAQSANDVRNG